MKNLFSVGGRVAIVTGGSQKVGEMIAEDLVAQRARVYICTRKAEVCEATAARLSKIVECISQPCDLSTTDEISSLVEQVGARKKQLDILVNNAGATWGPSRGVPTGGSRQVDEHQREGGHRVEPSVLPLLRASASAPDPARMIVTSLIDRIMAPTKANFPHSPSKAGMIQLARHIAKVLASEHTTVNRPTPSSFDSKMMTFSLDDLEARASIEKVVPCNGSVSPNAWPEP